MTGPGTRRGRLEAPDLLLLGAALALPWAFGGVPTWAFRAAEVLVAAAVLVAVAREGAAAIGFGRRRGWTLPAILLLCWGGTQVVPLPPGVVRALSPAAARVYDVCLPSPPGRGDAAAVVESLALARVPGTAPPPRIPGILTGIALPAGWVGWRTLSLQPGATLERTLWFLALLLAFALAAERTREAERAALYRDAMHALFGGVALFGLVQHATWNGRMYWFYASDTIRRPFGPFVNANHFAALMAMAVPWMAATAISRGRKARRPLLDPETVVRAAGASLCVLAGFVAASKAGAVLVAGGLLVVSCVSVRTRRARLGVVASAVALGLAGAALLSSTDLGIRVGEAMEQGGAVGEGRFAMLLTGTSVIRDYPLTGTGFGTFRNVIPGYQPAGEAENWLQAHDDYLEFAIEGGGIGLGLLAWLALAFVRGVASAGRGRGSPERTGLLVGIGVVALHSFVEFHLQLPGVALLWVLASSIAVASPPAFEREGRAIRFRRFGSLAVAGCAAALALWGLAGIVPGVDFQRGRRWAGQGRLHDAEAALEAGSRGFDRYEGLWTIGEVRLGLYDGQAATRGADGGQERLLRQAAESYLAAAAACPVSSWSWSGLAGVYARAERLRRHREGTDLSALESGDPWSAVGREGRVAVGLARFAAEREPRVFRHWDALTEIYRGWGLDTEAREAFRRSAAAEPDWLAHDTIDWDRLPREMVREFADTSWSMVGKTPLLRTERHLVVLGQLERRIGRLDRAEEALRRALRERASDLERAEEHFHLGGVLADEKRFPEATSELEAAARHPRFTAAAASDLARTWDERGDPDRARTWIEAARRAEPSNPWYATQAARMAMRRRDWTGAIEAWRWVILLDPRAGWAGTALAESYLGAGRPGDAAAALEAARQAGADPAEVERLRARLGGAAETPR